MPSQPFAQKPRKLVLADDALFDQHRSRGYHPERPERLEAARRGIRSLEADITVERLAPRDATTEEILRAHAEPYVEELGKLAGHVASLDADTYLAPASVAAAKRAAGAAIAAVEGAMTSQAVGVALVRPPGHHATRDQGMGFCLLNNASIAAYHALASGLSRVAIVDWDVHHGNGTQDVFYEDPRVLFISLHQSPLYPGTGSRDEVGRGEGKGSTLNVPLAANATDAVYERAFESLVVPVLSRFEPELLIISAGFDAHTRDPLASMDLTEKGYASMARELAKVAAASAKGRIVMLLEGGYDLGAVEASVAAAARALATGEAGDVRGAVDARHAGEIDAARAVAKRAFVDI